MKKKRVTTILAWVMVVLVMALLAGCGSSESGSSQADQAIDKKAEQPADAITMADLTGKFASVPGIYFEMDLEVEEAGKISTAKFWVKGENMRSEMESPDGSGTLTNIINASQQEAFMILGGEMAMRIDISQATEGVTMPGEAYEDVDASRAQLVGYEKVNDKDCAVFEVSEGSNNVKYWIWEEYGFPVKTEITADGQTTTVEYKNVKVEEIPDSMFEIPAGIEILDMNGMMLNIPQP